MNQSSLVSIITPVYKAELYIERCIQSVHRQSYHNWELLLIDDGSPDNSGFICEDYARKDTRIKVYHKQNGGVGSARNMGLNKAKGDWVLFLDSDDWLSDNCIETCLSNAEANRLDALQFNLYKVYSNGKYILESNIRSNICSLDEYINSKEGTVVVSVGGGFYNKKIIDDNEIRFNEKMKYAEDGIFVCSVLSHSKLIMHISAPLYYYYMNDSSAMHSIDIDAYLDSMLLQIEFLDNHPLFQKLYRNLVTMNVGRVCVFSIKRQQRKRLKQIWLQYRDNSPYVHIEEYHYSRSVELVFLPIQRVNFTLALYLTALSTKLFWMFKR